MAQSDTPTTSKREPEDLELEMHDSEGRRGLRQLLEERPLAAGVVSLALGLLAGLAVPRTRREDELLGTTRDRLLEQAREKGRETLDRGKRVAQDAVAVAAEEIAGATSGRTARPSRRRAPRATASS